MIIETTVLNWSIYLGGDIEPGRYMVMLSNQAMKAATFDLSDGWRDEAGNSLRPEVSENFVIAYAGAKDIHHNTGGSAHA